ncbi:hydrogenase iron-sulfur subunit [Bacteroidota bacterium]
MYKDKKSENKSFEPKVLVFACNWCSYAGADNAGVSRIPYSPNVRLLRVMCSGRVHPSFVLKAFAEGSDGVIVSGCHFGDCHYMFGNYKAKEQYERLENIINLLGLEPERITLKWISAAEGPRFAEVINEFVEKIRKLGPSPLSNGHFAESLETKEINLKEYHLYECLECGRCTAVCPVAQTHQFSPRRLLSKGISKGTLEIAKDKTVWSCLTCRLCENVCPANIPYSDLNKKIRSVSYKLGVEKTCTHGGVFEQITNLMTRPDISQKRLKWITEDMKVNDKDSDTLFYTGCSPYFAAYFSGEYEKNLLGSLKSAVKIMNKVGIIPIVLENELCCGHDLLLRGEEEKFNTLAQMLAVQIANTQAKRIVFTCPECFVTIRDELPKVVGRLNVDLIHLSELLDSEMYQVSFRNSEEKVTYQDPCRLGRYSNIYDQPRNILNKIEGLELKEMNHNKERSICCGNTAWIGCDAGTKEIQNKRLHEAVKTNSPQLLTSCPKCYIHLSCAENGDGVTENQKIKIRDFWEFVHSHLQ